MIYSAERLKVLPTRIHSRAIQALLCSPLIFCLLFFSYTVLYAELLPRYTLSDDILSSPDQLRPFLEDLHQYSLDHGVRNFYTYSGVLINECNKALQEKDYSKALVLAEFAEKLSPDLPSATIAATRSEWANNKLLVFHAVYGYAVAWLKQMKDLASIAYLLATTALALLAAFVLTLCVFCGIVMIKYFSMAIHDMKHIFLNASSHTAAAGWTSILFMLPLFFGLSIFWAALIWLLFLFSYQSKNERIVTIGMVIVCMVIPWLIGTTSAVLYAPQATVIKALWNSSYGYWDSRDIDTLQSLSGENADDQEALFALGLMSKKEKEYAAAEAYYKKVLSLKADHYSAHVNLGNVYFATKRLDTAIEEYNRAIAINPLQASAHYNLSRAYLQKFMFPESEAAFVKANTLNSALISYYFKIYSENPNRFLIDEPLSRTEIWRKAMQPTKISRGLADQLWDLLFRGVSRTAAGLITICLLAGVLLSATDTRFRIAERCKSCGNVMCRRCRHTNLKSTHCPQCTIVFDKKEGINPLLQETKLLDIKKYTQNLLTIIKYCTFIIPGSGYIWKGYPIAGSMLTFLAAFLLFKFILSYTIFQDPATLIISPSYTGIAVSAGLLLALVLCVVRSSNLLKDDKIKTMALLAALQKSFARSDEQKLSVNS